MRGDDADTHYNPPEEPGNQFAPAGPRQEVSSPPPPRAPGEPQEAADAYKRPVEADTGVHPDLLNSRFGYVSISRASHEATIFTDDMSKLSPQLSADVSKTSALEISPTQPMNQGISLGI